MFTTLQQRGKTANKFIYYFSTTKVEVLVSYITGVIMFFLLVFPIILLYRLRQTPRPADGNPMLDALGVFVFFTLLFITTLMCLMNINRHELFAALAVYCAVLATFVGSTNDL